jgi:hypothetical protein
MTANSEFLSENDRPANRRQFLVAGSAVALGAWVTPQLKTFAAASGVGGATTSGSGGLWSDPANILLNSSFQDGGLGTTIPNWVLA